MLLRSLVRVLNWFLAITGIMLLAGFWWFFWRPLPQTSGTVAAPVSVRVSVVRDALGVPHIQGGSQGDVLFAQGYVTAQERLWQMDMLRRASAGDLSEIVGPAAIAADEAVRRLRMRRIAEAAYGTLPPQDRADIAAYVRGVNYFIDTHHDRLPFEFAAISYSPRPWSAVDTILIGLYMFRTLTEDWREHIQKRDLLAGGDPEKVAYLFPSRAGNEIRPGSNAWVVSGAHTLHGHPQLSNDMHLEYSVPGIWFMTALEAPGLKVAGVSLPGAPGVIVGHNQRIAWGVTNLGFNVEDLYREKIDDRTGQYEFQGHMEQARLERELIPVKGQKPVELRQWVTRHGPVFLNEKGEHMALKWVAGEPNQFAIAFVNIDRARNWQEFNTAVSQFPGPAQNFVYADVDGNIGYHASGRLPIRRGFSGDVPLDGASGQSEWDGYIPYEQLPAAFNPPGGVIVTANQNPFPPDYPYTVSGTFASPFRSKEIYDRLLAKPKLTPQDTLAIQKDVYSSFHQHLAQTLTAAYDRHPQGNQDLKPAVDILRNFDGQIDKDGVAPFIVTLTNNYVRKAVAENASPGKGDLYSLQMSYAVIDRLLRERPAGWFADYDAMLLTCLRDALQEAGRMQGHNMSHWRYGRYMQLTISHPIASQIPGAASYFNIGPLPMSGGSTTIKQTTRRLGPSERMNAVVGDWDQSLLNVVLGQSGHVLSSHYKDEWDAYYNGKSFPMQFEHVEGKSTLTLVPQP